MVGTKETNAPASGDGRDWPPPPAAWAADGEIAVEGGGKVKVAMGWMPAEQWELARPDQREAFRSMRAGDSVVFLRVAAIDAPATVGT